MGISAAAERVRQEESIARFHAWNELITDAEIPQIKRAKARLDATFLPGETEARSLASRAAFCYSRPDWFVAEFFPWGEGVLTSYTGPDTWQAGFLRELGSEVRSRQFDGVNAVSPIRMAVASGHGIGKSTLVAWIVAWILSTRPDSQGTITANTFPQLETKTWAAIQRWLKICRTRDWFQIGSDRIYRLSRKDSWFVSAQTSREENSESFAGQHAATSTSYYILDEASAIPEIIWEVAEGGLTDGEPMIFCFGNPTRSTGRFFKSTFGSEKHRWLSRSIDSRESKLTNKETINEWITEYGEDSDFVRVRVRGVPPRASDLQFIDSERVYEAQRREPILISGEPLVAGLDIARGGSDSSVICFRRGVDAVTIPPIKIPGEQTRDSMLLVSKAAVLLKEGVRGIPLATLFVDVGGVGAGVYDRLRQLNCRNVVEVNFGSSPPGRLDADINPANMRAYMWGRMKNWLLRGSIPKDPQLEQDLTGPGFRHDKQERLLLESKEDMKKRGLASPDYADALALTFAQPLATKPLVNAAAVRDINRRGVSTKFGWS